MGLSAAVGVRESSSSSVRRYFEMAADRLGIHPEMRRLLSAPFRELTVEIPLRRDDERLQLFRGYRVQHNGVRGPLLGPVGIQSGLDLDSVRSAAESMTWRCAAANIPFGGAAGAIVCDSTQLSRREFESLVRKYTARIHHLLGVYQDLCAPGLNADEEVMMWMRDEYSSLQKGTAPAVLGKPEEAGGVRDHAVIIGRSLAALAIHCAEQVGLPASGLRVAIRSLDQSALHTALPMFEAGCVIVAIADARGGLRCSTGIDIHELSNHVSSARTFAGYERAAEAAEIHGLDCDVLIIGGPESMVNPAAASRIRAKLVLETSELVITPTAERILANHGATVVPDLVSAAGPVIAAYAEWSNNAQHAACDAEHVEHEVQTSMMRTYTQVLDRSRRENVSLRMAAYCSAIERVARCERLRVA
ncbi:MAG TPA: Glu/Leu/Phe/Val dehydrogenase dimerization domain-containing protein [Candidatus Sulfotelmatobacter sp.]|nr:Glu/Leu/Phe/Val dehydrogenase dimerization domain-containing protein [Candidatus Sulfotelmatobacter sp.]